MVNGHTVAATTAGAFCSFWHRRILARWQLVQAARSRSPCSKNFSGEWVLLLRTSQERRIRACPTPVQAPKFSGWNGGSNGYPATGENETLN
jgi:hypothetical protein